MVADPAISSARASKAAEEEQEEEELQHSRVVATDLDEASENTAMAGEPTHRRYVVRIASCGENKKKTHTHTRKEGTS